MRAPAERLAPREREILDVLYRYGDATAREVQARLPHQPNYSTVRTQLRVLTEKGHVRCTRNARAHMHAPSISRNVAGREILKRVVEIYFGGSKEEAIATLLERKP